MHREGDRLRTFSRRALCLGAGQLGRSVCSRRGSTTSGGQRRRIRVARRREPDQSSPPAAGPRPDLRPPRGAGRAQQPDLSRARDPRADRGPARDPRGAGRPHPAAAGAPPGGDRRSRPAPPVRADHGRGGPQLDRAVADRGQRPRPAGREPGCRPAARLPERRDHGPCPGLCRAGLGNRAERRSAAGAAGLPDRQERHREGLRRGPARPCRDQPVRGQRARPRDQGAVPLRRRGRSRPQPHHRPRPAALCLRAAERRAECRGRGPRRRDRGRAGARLGADLRSARVHQRPHPGHLARAHGQRQLAPGQQGDRRPVPAGLDVQAADRARGPRGRRDRAGLRSHLQRLHSARRPRVPLLEALGSRPAEADRRHRPILRRLLLRPRPARRRRCDRRDGAPVRARPDARDRSAGRASRAGARPGVEAGDARRALAARGDADHRDRPGLHADDAAAAGGDDGADRQRRPGGPAAAGARRSGRRRRRATGAGARARRLGLGAPVRQAGHVRGGQRRARHRPPGQPRRCRGRAGRQDRDLAGAPDQPRRAPDHGAQER